MAVSPDFPPFEFIDNTKSGIDQYVGADIELGEIYRWNSLALILK